MTPLEKTDPEIAGIIERELERQNTTIQLIASENFTSRAVLEAQGSVLTNKYSEGYPAKRYYGGNFVVDEAENLARERARALFGAEHVNVQPHSGANANQAAYMALLEPGDKVMGMRLDQGGHLTHGSPVNFSGRMYDFVAYGVDDTTEVLDYDEIRDLAVRERPRMIIAGATAYSRTIDFEAFRAIADEVDALAAGRRRPHRGFDRRRRAPVAGPVRRRRHVHDAQDAARPAGRGDPQPPAVRGRDRQGGVPRIAGRPAHARDRGQGRRVPRGESSRRSAGTPPTSSRTRRRARGRAHRPRASGSCRAAPTTT